ncbi:MAG: hypothetical protein J6B87_03555 [Clostridia bacterium]|nr:hypothetical protein [Clostridia bacterium]
MKNKVNILLISIVLTIIVYGISIYMQKKLVQYVPTVKCLIITEDVEAYSQIDSSQIKEVDMPAQIVGTTRVIKSINDVDELYLKEKIYAGQILIKNQFDTKENLSIYQASEGKEKVSIKIKSAENGVSYNIKENSRINVYATIRNEYANQSLDGLEKQFVGSEEDGYCIVTLLKDVKVLGVFNIDGQPIENIFDLETPDTVLVAVTPEQSKQINLIRDIATFNITALGEIKEASNEENMDSANNII